MNSNQGCNYKCSSLGVSMLKMNYFLWCHLTTSQSWSEYPDLKQSLPYVVMYTKSDTSNLVVWSGIPRRQGWLSVYAWIAISLATVTLLGVYLYGSTRISRPSSRPGLDAGLTQVDFRMNGFLIMGCHQESDWLYCKVRQYDVIIWIRIQDLLPSKFAHTRNLSWCCGV